MLDLSRAPAPALEIDETERDSWLKLVLLAVAVILVAGYTATVTDVMGSIGTYIAALLAAGPVLPVAISAGLFALGVIVFVLVRWRATQTQAKAGDETADVPRRDDFLQSLALKLDAHAKSGRQLAIHLIDIDRFSLVNEVLGETEGDDLLRAVRERLALLVGRNDRLARIGDDEFAVIQPEAGSTRHADIYARRIQDALKDVIAQIPRRARPGVSIGVAISPDHGSDAAKLLLSASLALRAAKNTGGEAFRLFSREMEKAVGARVQIEKAIRDGLHHGWFALTFQPLYDLRMRRLTGFEALVRLNHPQLGEQLPAAFLGVAEECGLIRPLGDWIIRAALATASEWPRHLTLSLNISNPQFRHGDVAGTILDALAGSRFEPNRLRVEISEAVLLEQSTAILDQLRRLKSRGLTVVIDDFGVQHSLLRALPQSACDAIKIDRTLVGQVGEHPGAESFVRSLIQAARAFDLYVIAEGVERAEQVHFLMSNDCDNVQGHLFGRPAAASEVAAIIARDIRKGVAERPAESRIGSAAA